MSILRQASDLHGTLSVKHFKTSRELLCETCNEVYLQV